jgi:hypothetical protein
LSTLRAAINWGRFQDPPYLATTPFHRFGVTIETKEETKRDRRIGVQEEQALLRRLILRKRVGASGPLRRYAPFTRPARSPPSAFAGATGILRLSRPSVA